MSRSNFTTLERCKRFWARQRIRLEESITLHWRNTELVSSILRLESSVIPVILPWVFFVVSMVLVSLLYYLGSQAFTQGNRVLPMPY